jgi:hypothetical protein
MPDLLERLKHIVPIPANPIETGVPDKWQVTESMIGTELPPDYKAFINTYGSGLIGNFIYLWHPFTRKPYMNLILQLTEFQSLATSDFEATLPHPIYPAPNGLLPFGNTINGDTLFWITTHSPAEWTLLILDRSTHDQQVYAGKIIDFFADLLENKINVSATHHQCFCIPPRFKAFLTFSQFPKHLFLST